MRSYFVVIQLFQAVLPWIGQMIPSGSAPDQEGDNEAPKAKRSKPARSEGDEEVVFHPVKMSRSDLYRPPTVEELNQLKEADNLFHCSLLKMQVRRAAVAVMTAEEKRGCKSICNLWPPTDGRAAERGCLE